MLRRVLIAVLLIGISSSVRGQHRTGAGYRNDNVHQHSGHGLTIPHAVGGGANSHRGVTVPGHRTVFFPAQTGAGISQRTSPYRQAPSSGTYRIYRPDGFAGHSHSYSTPPELRQYSAGSRSHVYHDHYSSYPSYLPNYGLGFAFPYSAGYAYGYDGIIAPPITLPYGAGGVAVPVGPVPFVLNDFGTSLPAMSSGSPFPAPPTSAAEMSSGVPAFSSSGGVESEVTIVNEYGADENAAPMPSGTVQRLQSLRYQTSADDFFRQREYSQAEALYRTAADTAPDRRAPWFRLAWVRVAQQNFPDAVRALRQGLILKDDPTSAWITGKELYGANLPSEFAVQNDRLWNWLMEKPQSTDRLLLVSAFQQLKGYTGVSRELLQAADNHGLPGHLSESLSQVVQHQAQMAAEKEAAIKEAERSGASATNGPVGESGAGSQAMDAPQADGIRLKGRDILPPDSPPGVLDLPVPVPANDSIRSETPPKQLHPEPVPLNPADLSIPSPTVPR